MPRPFRMLVLLAAAAALLVAAPRAQDSDRTAADALKARIESALAAAPRNYPQLLSPRQAGVRLQRVDIEQAGPSAQRIVIDLSQRAVTYEPSGHIEPLLNQIIEAAAPVIGASRSIEYRFTIDGLPLDRFLPRVEPGAFARRSLVQGGMVLISPGHGWYWDETAGYWHLQRPRIRGIVEDVVNWDIARYLRDELLAAHVNAQVARYPERDAVVGMSGNPRWQEGAKYFIQSLGAPADIWNLGVDDYARDINVRPLYANWIGASAVISIHNNGGAETGTETWYDETNGQQEASRRLAQIVNAHIVSAVRASYNPNWVDRGLRSCNGCKGENRLASMPAVIVEIAYMDRPAPDNDALHDEAFKYLVAQALSAAIREWSSGSFGS